MALRDRFAKDAVMMAKADHFGEAITWYPNGDLFAGRQVRAIVDRQEIEPRSEGNEVQAWSAVIYIPNDSTVGITSTSQKDLADVVLRIGRPAERVRVLRIINADEGFWTIEVAR